MKRCLIVVAVAMLAAAQSPDVRAQGDDIAGILNEITQLSGELEKDIPRKLEESLSLKNKHQDEIKYLDQIADNLQVEKSGVEAAEAQVVSVCNVTVPEEQYAAAVARCDAAKEPYLRRLDHYNNGVDELHTKTADVNEREQQRANEAQELLAHRQDVINRIGLLKAQLAAAKAAKLNACTATCNSGSKDAAAQCLQSCFDGARGAGELPPVEGFVRPPFSAGTRTPEQAIEEYRRSGAANPGPNSLHTNPVPPPSP